jgi:hypothetical protein
MPSARVRVDADGVGIDRRDRRGGFNPPNPNRVALMMDVPDMDAMMAAMQTKAAADAMEFDW